MTRFDAIIIGAGQAGPPLAGRLTAAGMTVAIVERKLFGGTCVNTGCMPTKTLVASAYAAHLARRAADYGVVIDGAVRVDMAAREGARRHGVGQTRAAASRTGCAAWSGCTVIAGPRPLRGARHHPRRRRAAHGAAHLHQRRRPRPRAGPARRPRRAVPHQHARCWRSTSCRGTWSSSAAATSASSSRRCTAASAPR